MRMKILHSLLRSCPVSTLDLKVHLHWQQFSARNWLEVICFHWSILGNWTHLFSQWHEWPVGMWESLIWMVNVIISNDTYKVCVTFLPLAKDEVCGLAHLYVFSVKFSGNRLVIRLVHVWCMIIDFMERFRPHKSRRAGGSILLCFTWANEALTHFQAISPHAFLNLPLSVSHYT